jgi:hypothetical protein
MHKELQAIFGDDTAGQGMIAHWVSHFVAAKECKQSTEADHGNE